MNTKYGIDNQTALCQDAGTMENKSTPRAATELLTHRLNVALRALTLIREMARKRRVNMQDGTRLESFASLALKEADAKPQAVFSAAQDPSAIWTHNDKRCACGSNQFHFRNGYWVCVKCDALFDSKGAEVTQ